MKSKTSANITPDVETDGKAIATPETPISDEMVVADKAAAPEGSAGLADGQTADIGNQRLSDAAPRVEAFDVRPSETVSIVAGNRVLFLGEGLKEIRITR